MKTIAMASQKGGVGKSTISIHLAVTAHLDNKNVLLVDLDPHSKTATRWAENRVSKDPVVVQAELGDIDALIKQAKDEQFDYVILDCPPYVNDVVSEVTKYADYTLVPTQPNFPDLQTLFEVVEQVEPPYSIVLSRTKSKRNGMEVSTMRDVRNLVIENNLPIYEGAITNRDDYSDALYNGESVNEFDSNSKSTQEVEQLYKWLKEQTNG